MREAEGRGAGCGVSGWKEGRIMDEKGDKEVKAEGGCEIKCIINTMGQGLGTDS